VVGDTAAGCGDLDLIGGHPNMLALIESTRRSRPME
jgi:hypothetical protein